MTKEEIIELQSHVYLAKGMYWKLLLGGKFPNDDYAKAIFTAYFALDKIADLTDKYLLQLPLEELKPNTGVIPLFPALGSLDSDPPPFVNSKTPGAKLHRRRARK